MTYFTYQAIKTQDKYAIMHLNVAKKSIACNKKVKNNLIWCNYMKRFLTITTCFMLILFNLNSAERDTLYSNSECQENYSWELSDKCQKKVAVGMIAWGFLMTAVTVVAAIFIPHSFTPSTTTTTSS